MMSSLIEAWEICYRIYPDPNFLKTIIKHYTGHRFMAWFDIVIDDWETKEYTIIHNSHFNDSLLDRIVTWEQEIKRKEKYFSSPQLLGGDIYTTSPISFKKLLEVKVLEKNQEEAAKKEASLAHKKGEILEIAGIAILGIILFSCFFYLISIA